MTAMTDRPPRIAGQDTAWLVLVAIGTCHMLNDVMQSLLTALYPVIHDEFALDYMQIGLLTFAFQVTAAVLQPVVGIVTDKRPAPFSAAWGMVATIAGVLMLAFATGYPALVAAAGLIGLGSAIFHPEASRMARFASGGRYGTAQSIFQVGGNAGSAAGPLLAAFIVVPIGRLGAGWFALGAFAAFLILWRVGGWYAANRLTAARPRRASVPHGLPRRTVITALVVLAILTFVKNAYLASMSSYYTFYVIETFGVSTQDAQLMLFAFLAASAAGVLLGGPIGDRFGPLFVIWFSILGVLPFALWLPFAGPITAVVLTVIIGVVMASAFPAIIVFAQELVPGRVGLVGGIYFGLAFGMAGISAALMGMLADDRGIRAVFLLASVLPAFGLLTVFLPRGILRAA